MSTGSRFASVAIAVACAALALSCTPSPRASGYGSLSAGELLGLAELADHASRAMPLAAAFSAAAPAAAAPGGEAADTSDLAKKTQNPVSDLISVPFQNNLNFGVGPRDKTQYILNVQPVYPMRISGDWNWIHRVIVPGIDQPDPAPKGAPPAIADALEGERRFTFYTHKLRKLADWLERDFDAAAEQDLRAVVTFLARSNAREDGGKYSQGTVHGYKVALKRF